MSLEVFLYVGVAHHKIVIKASKDDNYRRLERTKKGKGKKKEKRKGDK